MTSEAKGAEPIVTGRTEAAQWSALGSQEALARGHSCAGREGTQLVGSISSVLLSWATAAQYSM